MSWTDEDMQKAHRRLMVAVEERNVARAALRGLRDETLAHQAELASDETWGPLLSAAGAALGEPRKITGHVFRRCSATRPGDEHRADGCKNANRCHWVSPHDCAACGALPEEHVAA